MKILSASSAVLFGYLLGGRGGMLHSAHEAIGAPATPSRSVSTCSRTSAAPLAQVDTEGSEPPVVYAPPFALPLTLSTVATEIIPSPGPPPDPFAQPGSLQEYQTGAVADASFSAETPAPTSGASAGPMRSEGREDDAPALHAIPTMIDENPLPNLLPIPSQFSSESALSGGPLRTLTG